MDVLDELCVLLVSGRSSGLPETGFLREHERNVRVNVGNARRFCYICCGASQGAGAAGDLIPVDTGRGVNHSSLCRGWNLEI